MNIILINTDQQRMDSLAVYGNEVVRTPHIDSLAAGGVVFDGAFTTAPICGPARASILTGLYPVHHGILRNPESGCDGGKDFEGDPFFFNHGLNDGGYRCHHIGKWHVGTSLEPSGCGWEGVFYPGYGYPAKHPDYLRYLQTIGIDSFRLRDQSFARYKDGTRGPLLSAIQEGGPEASVPHYLTSQVLDVLKHSADDEVKFFLRCDFWGPHVPYIIPEEYMRMYDPADVVEPASFADTLEGKPLLQRQMKEYWGVQDHDWDVWARLTAASYGYISLIDFEIGRILALVDKLGIKDNTAVFFTSDHGGMVGSHGLCDKGPYLYDDICRVPMIVAIPGLEAAVRSDAFVYNMDLCPTFLELAGCPIPGKLDGRSLIPLLDGSAQAVREEVAFLEFYGHQVPVTQKLIRTRDFKYIFNSFDEDEYYDLENDPNELVNLIRSDGHTKQIRKARGMMLTRLEELSDPVLPYYKGSRMH